MESYSPGRIYLQILPHLIVQEDHEHMFTKTNMDSMGLNADPRWYLHGVMYGMHLNVVLQRLTDRYYTYHAYDYYTMSYLMVFWSRSGPKASGSISFDKDLKTIAIHFSTGHGLERWFSPDWTYILPESLYRRLIEKDIQHLDQWELQTALDEIYARRGMRFLDDYTAAHFIQQSWYEGVIDEDAFTDDMLSDVERYNITFLERHMGPLFFITQRPGCKGL